MKKTSYGFSYMMKNPCFLLLWCSLVALAVLNAKTVQCEELVDIQSWADFQTVNLVSVSAVAEDCRQIFDTCRADSQKVIDNLTQVVQSTEDAAIVPPKIWDALMQLNDILKNTSKNVRHHFNEIGEHFLKRLDGAISIAKFKKFEKIQQLQNIYNAEIDTANESVLTLEKSFSTNYNPNSNLQQPLVESLKQETYSPSIAEGELQQLSVTITEELDNLERSAVQLLNQIYKGITVAKEVLLSLKTTGVYPQTWDEQYIKDHLQSCSFLAKALKIENKENDANTLKSPEPVEGTSDTGIDGSADTSAAEQPESEDAPDHSGCGEVFRNTEKKIMKQLVIAIKEIKSMKNAKEIDSRTFKIFKNYSVILSNLNKKIVSNVITVVNQFFQLYNIVLSILNKINPGMKAKAHDILYITDVDATDSTHISINKYIVEDYLSSSKMKEFHERIDNHVKTMKSLTEVKKAIVQELGVTTNELGQELQTMKSTIFHIFEEMKNGVKALQNLKNKSNILGFRYYLNYYKGKADLAQLTKLIYIINSLNIELLLERQLLNDEDEMKDYELATSTTQNEINQENEKLLNELNSMSDFNFVGGFVSKSALEYNMLLQSYTVESRKTLKKVITKYVTVFEEIIIIIKRKKIKNAETFENLFNNEESTSHDETVSKYLLENTNVDVEQLCSSISQDVVTETKETAIEEIRELNTVTHAEVNKINEKVKSIINTLSTEIQNLKITKEQMTHNVEYEISEQQSKCILNIIQLINSLQIKSSKDEIQSLNIYFEKVKEKIQIAIQNFETQTTECNDMQQFKNQIESLKTSIYESLTKASNEINERIGRVIFEYNKKLYVLQKNTMYSEWNCLEVEETTFTLNDNTRKYITGCYTSAEIFKNVDKIISTETNVDISQLKTDLSTQLDDTNQKIETELNSIHEDLNNFVHKFSEGMKVVAHIEAKSQKHAEQAESVIEQAEWDKLKEVNEMVRVISKNVNILAENSERELKVQIDNARLQISKHCEEVSHTITALNDNREIETIITESISSCDKIYNELKNNTKLEINQNIREFSRTYEEIVTAMQTQSADTQSSFLQNLHQENYKTEEDKEYQTFVHLMHHQDYQSTTTVADSFNYLKKYNFVDSQSIKEKSTQIFQSLSNKINLEIDNISYVTKYMLESVQKANKVLIQLENSEKQSTAVSWKKEDLIELRKAKSIAESWKYSLEDNTMSSISSAISTAKSEIDVEYKLLKSKMESSSDESIIQTEVQNTIQKIENIYTNTQTSVNKKIQQSSSNFYNSMSTYISEFQSCGSETLYTTMESILNGRNVGKMDKGQGVSQNVNFDIFSSQSTNIRELYTETEIKDTQESSDVMVKTNKNVDELKQTVSSNVESLEKTSTYVVENIQKGFTIMTEIQTAVQQDYNYQLTQYQEEQLRKCITVYRKVENLNVNTKSAQERITKNIDLVRNEISHEYTKVSELISSLSDEKAVEETVTLGVNKFEQLYSQAKETVKEQLSLTSSKFYSSFTNLLTTLEQKSTTEVSKTMLDIKNGNNAYQAESDQSFMETISYFNSKSFKSCSTIKSWFNSIHSSTTAESHYSVNDRGTTELSSVSEQINSSLDKMQISSTYVLQSIEKSTETLKQMEVAMKQNTLNQLTQEQIVELQRCMSLYKSVQVISSSSTSTTIAQETIQIDISNVKNEINSVYSELTQSISSLTDEKSIEETAIIGVKKFEQLYSRAKVTVKEELSQSLTSFYTSFTQISTDLQQEANNDISIALQDVRSSAYQSENNQSFQETVSYFTSESFKSCVTIKNWFKEIHTSSSTNTNINVSEKTVNDLSNVNEQINISSSTNTNNNVSEKTVNDLSSVNEQINSSLEKMEISSTYVLESIQKSTEILRQIESSVTQSTTFKLSQEQVTELKNCMSIYQSIQTTVSTSTSTSLAQQTIQTDISNTKEEISSAYTQITETISSLTEESIINETSTKGIEKFENLFSQVKGTVKEQLYQISSSFYSYYTQISSDLHHQNQQSTMIEESTNQSESDQTFTNMLSCFKSDVFKSNTVVNNWYKKIHTSTTTTEYSYLGERVVSEFSTLNERVTHSIESIQENSAYVLETIKKGSEILKQLEESTIQESTCELTHEQKTYLQKCMTIYQTIETIKSTTTSTAVTDAKQSITSDIDNVKSQINEEFTKVTESINSLSDESSIQQVATESVNHVNEYFSQTKEKVLSQLKLTSSSFFNDFKEISSSFESQGSQTSNVFSDIESSKNVDQVNNDQSYTSMLSYLTSDSFTSCNAIQNLYREIQSNTSNSETSTYNERTINELSSLNERVTQSINSMEESSTYVLETIGKGSEILTQVKHSSSNSNYKFSQDQIISLQKCVTIYQNIQSVTTTSSSTNISEVKQSITMDISNVRSQINDEFTKVSESIRSLTDENAIKETASKSVTNVDTYFSQTKEKIQSQLTETSSSFYQKMSSYFEKQKNKEVANVLQEVYQLKNDQSFANVLSYFTSDTYKSNKIIQTWYNMQTTTAVNTESANVSETTISQLNTLNERVTESVNSIEENSTYVLDTMEKASEILKSVEESSNDSNYQFSQEEITNIQKCVTIYQTISSSTSTTSSKSVSDVKQKISTDITSVKSQINDEFFKVSEKLRSITDENSIKEVVQENVAKVDEYYSQTQEKVRTQLTQTSNNFFTSCQQISSSIGTQENSSVLQEIITGESTYSFESDQSFTSVISYLNSDSYKTSQITQNWYSEIHSSTATSTNLSENSINELSTLNERVTKSIDSMEENSNYILDTIEKGSIILEEVQQTSSHNSNYQLSETQILDLQKCITIYQTIQTTTTVSNESRSVSNIKQTITSDISSTKTQISDEFAKVSQSIQSLSDETSIKQAVNENVDKVEQYYGQTREKVQSELTHVTTDFFNNYEQITINSENNDITNVLKDITAGKNTYQCDNDESYTKVLSYLNNDTFKSTSVIRNFYQEIQSSTTTSKSSYSADTAVTELGTLNDRVTKSIDEMDENSTCILNIIEKGSNILKEVQQTSVQNSGYQLSETQIIDLQKCITIYQTIQTTATTTSIESGSVSDIKQIITSDIDSTKTQINDEFAKVSQSIRSLSDETSIKQAVNENVDKVEQYYGQTREKVQSELTHVTSDFFNNYEQITTNSENNEVTNVLKDITAGKNTYQCDNDESYTKVLSYLNNETFKSTSVIQNFYQEIQSSTTTSESSYSADIAVTELGTLNDRVTKSIDEMDANSAYILNTIEKGSQVLKQLQEKTLQNSSCQLTSEQIIDLQKCITIHQSVQSITTSTSSTTTSNTSNVDICENVAQAERTIETEVGSIKTQIKDEYLKTADSIHSLSDESTIKQVVDENVHKVDGYYCSVQEKVQSQLTQTSSNFFNNYQQISTNVKSQGNSDVNVVLQEIVNGKTNQFENDESFTSVVSYLESEAFKSNTVTQIYENIQSNFSTAESTDFAEQTVSKLSTLSDETTKSVGVMEENSKYILNTMKKGLEVLKQVEESTTQGSNHQLTEDQIIDLQKCITIYQIIQSHTNSNSITVSGNDQTVELDQNNLTDQNVDMSSSNNVSNAERSIVENADVAIDETSDKDIAATIESNDVKESTVISEDLETHLENADVAIDQTSNKDIAATIESNDVKESTVTSEDLETHNNEIIDQTVENQVIAETNISVEVTNAEQKITTNVSNIKNQINDEYTKVSQSISSLSDETSIKQTVDENVNKVDQYYMQAKEDVQSQLTQTSTGFFTSVQKVSENLNKQGTNIALQDIINGKNTYQAENDEEFMNVISYFNSDSFKSCEEIHTWYQEIQSGSTSTDTVNLSERSINELNTLHDRVSTSVDTMEQRSKYVLDTIKKSSDVLKQVEEATKQDSDYELTQEQIMELQKCITIYQTIQSVSNTSTTTTNTFEVANDSVSNQYTTSDDEYEYVVNVTTNTRQMVQVEETLEEENEISVIQNRQISEYDVIEDAANVENFNSSSQSSAVTAGLGESNVQNESSSVVTSDSLNVESEKEENQISSQDIRSVDSHINGGESSSINSSTMETGNINNSISTSESSLDAEKNESNMENEISPIVASESLNIESEMGEIRSSSSQDVRSMGTQEDILVNDTGSNVDNTVSSTSSAVHVENGENEIANSQDINAVNTHTDINENDVNCSSVPQPSNINNKSASFETSVVNIEHDESSASDGVRSVEAHTNTEKKDVLSEFDVSSNKTNSKISNKSSDSPMKRTSHSSKMDLLKKYSQDQNTYSKTSLNALMVNWEITQSATAGLPNTCKSLNWENTKYCNQDDDITVIKEIADLLSVGRTVTEHTINLKKEKLPLYRDIDEIELQIVSCTEIVDEILLQVSEVIGEDIRVLKSSFYEKLNQSDDIMLENKAPSLDEQFLTTAAVFFSMKDTKKTDLLNQINKQFGNKQANNEDEAREIAIQKFDKLQAIMKTVLDNIDCLALRVVDIIVDAKNSLDILQNTTDNSMIEKYYVDVKNGQVLCDTLKIPNN